jgi:hypothetical protein
MHPPRALIGLSAILVVAGAAVAAAFFALIPGYQPLYLLVLALALVVALLAFRIINSAELRGSASAILSGCVIYWALGGSTLPGWINGTALTVLPVMIAIALFQLWKQRYPRERQLTSPPGRS